MIDHDKDSNYWKKLMENIKKSQKPSCYLCDKELTTEEATLLKNCCYEHATSDEKKLVDQHGPWVWDNWDN